MVRAVDPQAVKDYVCKADKDLKPEEQTVWPLYQLTAAEQAHCQNIMNYSGDFSLAALHLGLGQPKNFNDEVGGPVKFERDDSRAYIVGKKRPWADHCISRIPHDVREELAGKIWDGVGVARAQAKNS